MYILLFLFFKQKTAYEMRISDWSSDVCSSDLMVLADEMRDGQRDGPGHAVHGQCAGNGRELIAIEREVIALECDRRILRSVEEVGAEQMRVEFVDASGDRSHVNTDVDTAALLGQIKRRGATCGIELDRKSTRLNSSH